MLNTFTVWYAMRTLRITTKRRGDFNRPGRIPSGAQVNSPPIGISSRETRHMSLICGKIEQLINDINEDIDEHVFQRLHRPCNTSWVIRRMNWQKNGFIQRSRKKTSSNSVKVLLFAWMQNHSPFYSVRHHTFWRSRWLLFLGQQCFLMLFKDFMEKHYETAYEAHQALILPLGEKRTRLYTI